MGRIRVVAAVAVAVLALAAGGPGAASGETAVEKVPSRVVLLSDHSVPVKTWAPLEVRVRIEAEDGTPLAGRNMRIWDDSYERWRCCGPPPWRTTDANGEVGAVLYLDGNSANPVRVAAFWHGDDVYDKAIVEWYQPMVGYDTTLDVSHATDRTSGTTLPVSVSVRRTDPSVTTRCIDGAVVKVRLSGPDEREAIAVIDHDPFAGTCQAAVELPLDVTPGRYTLTASTGHEGWSRTDEPRTHTADVEVRWQHAYHDGTGRGSVLLNRATSEYRVVLADGRDSGIRYAGEGLTRTGVSGTLNVWRIDLSHTENGDSAEGAFYSTGSFTANGTLAGAPWGLSR